MPQACYNAPKTDKCLSIDWRKGKAMRFATVRELSRNLSGLEVEKKGPVIITLHGKPRYMLQVVDEDFLLLADPKVQVSIAMSRAERAAGKKGVSAKKILRSLRQHGTVPDV